MIDLGLLAPRACPLCANSIGFVSFFRFSNRGHLICPSCQQPISKPLLNQKSFQLIYLMLASGLSVGWFVMAMLDASLVIQFVYLLAGTAAIFTVLALKLFRTTPLLGNLSPIIQIDQQSLVIDSCFSRSHGIKFAQNVLTATDGLFSIPLKNIKSLRVNKGYFVIYREPDGDAFELFFPPTLEHALIKALRENGLGSMLTVETRQ